MRHTEYDKTDGIKLHVFPALVCIPPRIDRESEHPYGQRGFFLLHGE